MWGDSCARGGGGLMDEGRNVQRSTSKMHLGGSDLLDFEGIGGVFDQATYEIVPIALAQLESRSVSICLAAARNTFR
jgi:hypothetical protein